MRRLIVLILILPMMGCTKPSLQTILMWGKQGLDQVCAVGQNTLPTEVCMEGDAVIDLAIGIAQHDDAATRAAALKLIADAIVKFPQLMDYFGWLINNPQSPALQILPATSLLYLVPIYS